MSFKVIIEVENKDLGSLLAKLPRYKYDLKHTAGADPEPAQNGKVKPRRKHGSPAKADTRMKMTGKRTHSELLQSGLDLFERMEGERGIGSLTVEVFRNQINTNKLADGTKMQSRLVHEGFLEYIR